MPIYFKKNHYGKNDLLELEKEKRKLFLKHHPDRGGKPESFIKLQGEYNQILKTIETRGDYYFGFSRYHLDTEIGLQNKKYNVSKKFWIQNTKFSFPRYLYCLYQSIKLKYNTNPFVSNRWLIIAIMGFGINIANFYVCIFGYILLIYSKHIYSEATLNRMVLFTVPIVSLLFIDVKDIFYQYSVVCYELCTFSVIFTRILFIRKEIDEYGEFIVN